MYEYRPIEEAKTGDVLHWTGQSKALVTGNLYLMDKNKEVPNNDDKYFSPGVKNPGWKLIKTKPGSEAKVGDTVITVKDQSKYSLGKQIGFIQPVVDSGTYINGFERDNYLVLCKADNKPAFKAGDMVQLNAKAKAHFPKHHQQSTIATITKIYPDTTASPIVSLNQKLLVNTKISTHWLELVPDIPITACTLGTNIPCNTAFTPINTSVPKQMAALDEPTTKPQKETNMNPNDCNIKLEINGKNINVGKHPTAACLRPKTDLENELNAPNMAKIFNENGSYLKKISAKKASKVEALVDVHLQKNRFDTAIMYIQGDAITIKKSPLTKTKRK